MLSVYIINYFIHILELKTRHLLSLVCIRQHADRDMPAKKYYGADLKHSTCLKLVHYWCDMTKTLLSLILLDSIKYAIFQEVLNTAVSSWVNTGINQKMEMDVQPEKKFWTRPKIQKADTPLTISHLLLPFIFLASSLVLSMVTFCIEKNWRKLGYYLKFWFWLCVFHVRNLKVSVHELCGLS